MEPIQDASPEVLALIEKADHNDPDALFLLANRFLTGNGVKKDPMRALDALSKAAALDQPMAQYNLGNVYLFSQFGIPQDLKMAKDWYTKATQKGVAKAYYYLGYICDKIPEQRDYAKAMTYYLEAIRHGYADGNFGVGNLYYFGLGVETDYSKALEYFSLAGDNTRALYLIGYTYDIGKPGVPIDDTKAIEYYTRAADLGDNMAQNNLAKMYQDGEGTAVDLEKALKYYTLSANQGNKDALTSMGYLYEMDLGVEKDYSKAINFYFQSAQKKDRVGQFNLGSFYLFGKGTEKDIHQAIVYYTFSAAQGYAKAHYNLATIYYSGQQEIPKNITRAYEHFWLAKQLGYKNAEGALKKLNTKLTTQQIHIAINNGNKYLKNHGLRPVLY